MIDKPLKHEYEFTIRLDATGYTEEEAWRRAYENLCSDIPSYTLSIGSPIYDSPEHQEEVEQSLFNQHDKWSKATDHLQNKVDDAIVGQHFVFYSHYDLDEDDIPMDNLMETPYGHLPDVMPIVIEEEGLGYGDGQDYKSKPLLNPTWLELAVEANEMIKTTGNRHHVFFENLNLTGEIRDGCRIAKFSMGS